MTTRLNKIIAAFEKGVPAFCCFQGATIDNALMLSNSSYDGVLFDMEHTIWDPKALKDALQYMLDRKQIAASGSIASTCTPIVRVPANGREMNQWQAKQALDTGVYGVLWPHVSTADEARNAVASCRYARLSDKPRYEPVGVRGDGPGQAARYWGVTNQEYYKKADVWPLDPEGEILVMLMIENVDGVNNLDEMLRTVPGIGAIVIGEGDLSQQLGYPRQYDHPVVREAMAKVVATCRKYNVPVCHPHVEAHNVERILAEGYSMLIIAPDLTFSTFEKARALVESAGS